MEKEGDMVMAEIGVFDGVKLLAEFDNSTDADDYRRNALQLNLPEYVRRAPYDDLQIWDIPEDYDQWMRLLNGLRRSRAQDRVQEEVQDDA